jgi:ABC-2 type transport system permease protein
MTILRSISKEKSNRVVELILATVKPRQLMLGKIIGIGLSACLQFVFWVLRTFFGFYILLHWIKYL